MGRKKKNNEVLWRRQSDDLAERPRPTYRAKDTDLPEWMNDDQPPVGGYAGYGFKHHGDPTTGKTTWEAPMRSAWCTGDKPQDMEAKDCSWADKHIVNKPTIMLSEKVTTGIQWLMENKNVEWQMLLRGKVTQYEDGEVVEIDDYYIPKQKVTGATVRNTDCIDKKFIEEQGIVATIHSHVSMGAFFSSTDMTECNTSPLKYHIVMNNKFEYQSVKQVKLGCGMLKFVRCDVVLYSPEPTQPEGIERIEGGY